MIFYIADTHFGHANIIRYDNRPFRTVEEMDTALIERWNNIVSNDDTVYILGDFSWYREEETLNILKQLAGHKILIKGNHDKISPRIARQLDKVCDYLEITDGGTRVILCHYPTLFWNGQFRDSVHLYGHVHNSHQYNMVESWAKEARELQDIPMRIINVGCMMSYMNYQPQTLDSVLKTFKLLR